jgi:hypothetical protein
MEGNEGVSMSGLESVLIAGRRPRGGSSYLVPQLPSHSDIDGKADGYEAKYRGNPIN